MGSAPSYFTIGGLEGPSSRSLISQTLISQKGVELAQMLLLANNRKSYMGNPTEISDLSLSDLESSSSRSLIFQTVVHQKEQGWDICTLIGRYIQRVCHTTRLDLGRSFSSRSQSIFEAVLPQKGRKIGHKCWWVLYEIIDIEKMGQHCQI